jgi:branched-chain amino acid transport system substrate-binding protein
MNTNKLITALVAVGLACAVAACGSSSSSSASGGSSGSGGSSSATGAPIKIGASLTLTGTLATFGIDQQIGYQHEADLINSQGGLEVGGTKHKIQLTILDNKSDPATAGNQIQTLILQNGVKALVGPCAPDFVIPQALIADRNRIPYVDTCSPQEAFLAGNPAGWKYSYVSFFDEHQQALNMVSNAASVKSNKKIALFTDTEPDGKTERPLYKTQITQHGLTLAGDYTFPPGTSDFSSFINSAKSAGAQLVIAQMVPPDAIALLKQMKSLGFHPAVLDISKGADIANWLQVTGPLGNGTTFDQEYQPQLNPEAIALTKAMLPKMKTTVGVGAAASAVAAFEIVTNAMQKAGSTDPQKVNQAIASQPVTTVQGPVSFGANHVNKTPVQFAITQYQNGKVVYVRPAVAGGKEKTPMAGLG